MTAASNESNDLYLCGLFWTVNEVCSPDVAKWDGTNWSSLGSGLGKFSTQQAARLASNGGELYLGGNFTLAGGLPSARIALWNIPHSLAINWSGNQISLSWPSTGTNFILEASETIGQSNWAAVLQPRTILNDKCIVTNTISPPNQFYRLRGR